jgi:hypothetical protein
MKKILFATALLTSSLVFAQNAGSLAEIIKTSASEDFLFTGIEIPVLKQIMGDTSKSDTKTYNLKDAGGFEMSYKVTKTPYFVQIFESKMTYWITFNTYVTRDDAYIGMVTSAQKASNGRGNDLTFYSINKKKQVSPTDTKLFNYPAVVAFANGKCKVPKENIHFELKDGSDTIKISGFDIFLSGKKYTLAGELKLDFKTGGFVFDSKNAKC